MSEKQTNAEFLEFANVALIRSDMCDAITGEALLHQYLIGAVARLKDAEEWRRKVCSLVRECFAIQQQNALAKLDGNPNAARTFEDFIATKNELEKLIS